MPLSVLLTKTIEKIPLRRKISGLIVSMNLIFILIPVISLVIPASLGSYILMMTVYTIGYIIAVSLEASILASCALFAPKHVVSVFILQPTFNVVLTSIKLLLLNLQVSIAVDFLVVWSLFVIVSALAHFFLGLVSKGREFRKMQRYISGKPLNQPVINLGKAFQVVKWEMFFIFLTYTTTFVTFPGVFYSLAPPAAMKKKTYINILNFFGAIFGLAGKPTAYHRANLFLGKVLLVMGLLTNIFLLFCFFTELYILEEGFVYIFLVLAAFMTFRNS